MSDVILQTHRLTKEFKGFTAVSNVDLAVERGSIHALIGPNGAGKTTCFNLLTKFLEPTSGTDPLQRAGHHPRAAGADRAARHHPLVPDLGGVPAPDGAGERAHRACSARSAPPSISGRARRRWTPLDDARHARCSREVGLEATWPTSRPSNLPYGRKRALEIATTLAMEPELMLLDEPTQGMGHEDVRPRDRAHQARVGGTHHPDGRAQHERGRGHLPTPSPCCSAAPCWPRAVMPRSRRTRR